MLNFKEFMNTMNITQSRYTNYTHKGVNAYDLAGKDSGIDPLYVPKGQTVKCIGFREDGSKTKYTFYEFQKPITLKNGSKVNKLQFMCLHGFGTDKVGNTYKAGKAFYDEGTMGNAQGNHVHIEFGTGYNNKNYFLKQNKYGNWTANFSKTYNIEDIFYIPKDLKVINSQGLAFKKETTSKSKITYDVWNVKNQYGANIYFYAQSYENGKQKHNQLDNDKNRAVYYWPEGYTAIKAVNKAYLYHDKNLSKKWINSKGNHSYIPKGKYVVAKFVGKVTK